MLPSIVRSRQTVRISSVLAVFQTRDLSSAEAKPLRVNKNISFRSAFDSPIEQEKRPICVIYGWLVAKSKHIFKYGDFYLGKGFDVMHLKIQPQQLLWPKTAQDVVSEALDFLGEEKRTQQPILVHGFSVGAYLYGETLVKMVNDPKYIPVGKRVVGNIYDSPAPFSVIPNGVGKAVTPVPVLQKMIKMTLDNYLRIFYNQTSKHYLRSEEATHVNPLGVPALVLYSLADPIGQPEPIKNFIKMMKDHDTTVFSKCWEDSKHVSHFQRYPVEYIRQLNDFLNYLGLTQYSEQVVKEKRAVEI